MTKRKTTKAAKALGPIFDKLQDKTGYFPSVKRALHTVPDLFIKSVFEDSAEELANFIINSLDLEYPKEEMFIKDGNIYLAAPIEPQRTHGGLTLEEALLIAREMKEAVEKAFEARLKRILPGEYPLSTHVIKQTLNPNSGLQNPSVECKDEGKLTAAHFKLEHAFLSLLEDTSANKNPESEAYFTGNIGAALLDISGSNGESLSLPYSQTQIRPRDIFRAYYGKGKLSGAERKNVLRAIDEYKGLNFTWVLEAEVAPGRIMRAEVQMPRIEIALISITDKETAEKLAAGDAQTREAEQWVKLKFHPAFLSFRQDGGSYAKTPKNLNSILETAAGGARKVTAAHYRLFHYLNSLRSSRKPAAGEATIPTEIGHMALIEKMGLKHYLESRNGHKLEVVLKDVISHLKAAGLIQDYKERAGKEGVVSCFTVFSSPVWLETAKGGRTLRKGG